MLLSIFFFVFHHHSLFVCLSLDAVKTQKFRIKFVYLQGKYPSCLESCFKWNTSCSDTLSPVVLANVSSKEEWEVRNPRNAKISCMHIYFGPVNPFIYFTPSRPLISSGSWLTLHNCDFLFISSKIWPCDYRSNFHQGQYLPRARGRGLTANFWARLFYQGHYLPSSLSPQY
jgi:hypothetical protein